MDNERLRRIAGDARFIHGIYNYCDRWCERCHFTIRCLNYAITEEQFPDRESRDVTNGTFWTNLEATFRMTLAMVREFAEERGIDLDASLEMADAEKTKKKRIEAGESALATAGMDYVRMANEWFASRMIEAQAQKTRQEDAALPTSEPDVSDAVEVIRWYVHPIHVKLLRALGDDATDDGADEESLPRDSDGSAKVSLIAMDRSIAAWGRLLSGYPDETDAILAILLHLSRLRAATEQEFPAARLFVRPGFDQEVG
jgi:hypothetical protein